MFDNLFNDNNLSAEKGSYEERSHKDFIYAREGYEETKQYCRICGGYRYFQFDRCVVCKSN